MRNPEYFWKDGQVVSYYFSDLDDKIPALIKHEVVACVSVDTNCAADTWGRIGRYDYLHNDLTWLEGNLNDLPAEFKTALLLLGVTP